MILPQCDSSSGWPQALKIMALSHVYAPSSSPSSKLGLLSHLHAGVPGAAAVDAAAAAHPVVVVAVLPARMFAFLEKQRKLSLFGCK